MKYAMTARVFLSVSSRFRCWLSWLKKVDTFLLKQLIKGATV